MDKHIINSLHWIGYIDNDQEIMVFGNSAIELCRIILQKKRSKSKEPFDLFYKNYLLDQIPIPAPT